MDHSTNDVPREFSKLDHVRTICIDANGCQNILTVDTEEGVRERANYIGDLTSKEIVAMLSSKTAGISPATLCGIVSLRYQDFDSFKNFLKEFPHERYPRHSKKLKEQFLQNQQRVAESEQSLTNNPVSFIKDFSLKPDEFENFLSKLTFDNEQHYNVFSKLASCPDFALYCKFFLENSKKIPQLNQKIIVKMAEDFNGFIRQFKINPNFFKKILSNLDCSKNDLYLNLLKNFEEALELEPRYACFSIYLLEYGTSYIPVSNFFKEDLTLLKPNFKISAEKFIRILSKTQPNEEDIMNHFHGTKIQDFKRALISHYVKECQKLRKFLEENFATIKSIVAIESNDTKNMLEIITPTEEHIYSFYHTEQSQPTDTKYVIQDKFPNIVSAYKNIQKLCRLSAAEKAFQQRRAANNNIRDLKQKRIQQRRARKYFSTKDERKLKDLKATCKTNISFYSTLAKLIDKHRSALSEFETEDINKVMQNVQRGEPKRKYQRFQ